MSAVAKQMKVVKSEFEATRTSVGVWGNELKESESKVEFLNKQMDLQKQKVTALTNAYEDSVTQKGLDAKETQTLATRLNTANAQLNKMQNELSQTTLKLTQFQEKQNTDQFQNDLNSLTLAMKKVDSEFKVLSTSADNFGDDLKQAGLQVQSLNQKMELQQQVVNKLEDEYKRVSQAKGQDATETKQLAIRLDEARAEFNGLQNEITETTQKLNKMKNELSQQSNAWGNFTNKMDAVGSKMQSVGGSVAATAGVGFATLTYAMKDAIGVGMEFGKQVSRVGAISEATANQVKELKNQSLDLGAKTSLSASEIAKGQEQLAASGFKVNEILSSMPGVISAVEASGEDMATVSEIMAAAIRGFGLEAEQSGHMADVFAMAANRSNASVADMGYSFKYAAPIAKQLGISVEELAAVTGLLRDRGMAAEQVGTSMRMGLTRLISPTDAAIGIMRKYGINIKDAENKMLPLSQVIGILQEKTKNLSQEQKINAFQTIFGTEAMTGFLNLVDAGPKQLTALTKALEESDGASAKAAAVMKDNLAGAVDQMSGAIETAKIQLTEALTPALKSAADFVSNLTEKWNSLDDDTKKIIATTGAMGIAILGVITVVGTLTMAIGGLLAFAGPIGLAIVGITAALGALGLGLYATHQKTELLKKKQEEAEVAARRYGEGLSEGTLKGVQGYTDLYEGAKLKMLELQNMSGEKAKATSSEVVKAFADMADQVIAALQTQKEKLANAINEVYGIAGDAGKNKAKEMTNEVIASFDKDIADYKRALDTVKEAHKLYQNDISKMPADFAISYQEALKVMQGGAKEFAASQEELHAIQQSIVSKQGKILSEEAQGYTKSINDSYKKSIESVNQYYSEKKEIFEQGLTQGRISQEQYAALMTGVEANTNQMLANAAKERENALKTLSANLDERGKLIDIATGKVLEKQTQFFSDMNGNVIAIEETNEEYVNRWKKHTQEILKSSTDFSKSTKKEFENDLIAFLMSQGETREQAVSMAKQMVNQALGEMEKGAPKAKTAGKETGESFSRGIKENREFSKTEGEILAKNAKSGWESVKTDTAGADFAKGFANGINKESQKSSIWEAAWSLGKSALKALKESIDSHSPSKETEKEGKNYADGFSEGVKKNTKSTAATAKAMAAAVKKSFETEFRNIDYRLDAKKISADQAIKELEKLKVTYKTVPNAVEKVNKEIYEINKKHAKEMAAEAKKQFKDEVQAIKDKSDLGKISLEAELKQFQTLMNKYKQGSAERIKLEKEVARVKDEILAEQFNKERAIIDKKKYYNDLSLTQELAILEKNMKAYKKGSEEREYYEREVYRVKKEIHDKLLAINDEYENKIKATNQRMIDEQKRLGDEYRKAVDDRAKSLYSFAGLFDEITKKSDVSGKQLIANLKSQVDTFKDWSKNIANLSAKGIDEGLLAELRAMGPGAAAEIAALNSLSDQELQQYVKLWQEKHAFAKLESIRELKGMKDETNQQIAEMRTETQKELDKYKAEWIAKIKEIRTGVTGEMNIMKASMKDIGGNSIKGLMLGMKEMEGPLVAQTKAMAEAISSTIRSTLKIKSPSQLTRGLGRFVPQGFAIGIKENIGSVIDAAKQLALASIPDLSTKANVIGNAASMIRENRDTLTVKNIIQSPKLEEKFDKLLELFSLMLGQAQKPAVNISLNYYGDNKEDAYTMVDLVESELKNRYSDRLAVAGVRIP
jgi:TP901 family phage tail tape measure protein